MAVDNTNILMVKVLLQPTKPMPIMHSPGPIVPIKWNIFLIDVAERRPVFPK